MNENSNLAKDINLQNWEAELVPKGKPKEVQNTS